MTTALERGEGSASRPGRSLPAGKDPVPIVQEAGWAPGPVWTGVENLASTAILFIQQFIEIYIYIYIEIYGNRSRKRCILLVVLWRYTCDARTYESQIYYKPLVLGCFDGAD